jgi:hypothetical protein
MRYRFSFSLGWYITVFQAEVMPLRHVLMRILKGATVIGIFIFSQTVKLQLKHLTTVRFAQAWYGIAINPS